MKLNADTKKRFSPFNSFDLFSLFDSFGCAIAAPLILSLLSLFHVSARAAGTESASTVCPVVGDEAVTRALKPIRQKSGVPAMAAAGVASARLEFVGAVGVRKRGTEIPGPLNDQWHLGSDCKAMTSTLVARLVERGQLKCDMTLAEVFPDL